MRAIVVIAVLSVLVAGEASAQMTQAMRDFIVAEHNRLRRDAIGPGGPDVVSSTTATAMLEMEYDMNLECVAQAYIETQTSGFTHNSNRTADYAACGGSGYVGENWYSGAPEDGLTGGATSAGRSRGVATAAPSARTTMECAVAPSVTTPRSSGQTLTKWGAGTPRLAGRCATTRPAETIAAHPLSSAPRARPAHQRIQSASTASVRRGRRS